MKSIEKFLTMIDIFGVSYNFRYKDKEKFQTSLGGFILILFGVLAIAMAIYYFIPFINRKNYTIVYYTMNLAKTEEVDLFASDSNFALGLSCESNKAEKYNVYELLDLKSRYVEYIKSRDGTFEKKAKYFETHRCTYDDFYNKYDAQFDYLNLHTYDCIVAKEDTIQGIFSDQIFSYYEYSVVAKNKSRELTAEIERFLGENDCKLQLVYTDIIIDLDNYENPTTQYLNQIFIQLNPTLFIKRNVYFMNQYFTNDDFLMFVFGDDQVPEKKSLYSRYEEYALWKGINRFETQIDEYEYYSKVYIRAELKKTVIKRKYQKFMEFYADASSLLIAIFEILVIILNFVDNFYAHHALAKSMFFFKDLEDKENFNILKKMDIIQEIISITEPKRKASENSPIEMNSKDNLIKNFPPKKNETEKQEIYEDGEEIQKEVKIYNSRIKNQSDAKQMKTSSHLKGKSTEDKKDYNIDDKPNKYEEKYSDEIMGEYDENYPKYKKNQSKRNKNSEAMLNFRYNNKNDIYFNESIGTNMDDYSDSERPRKRKKKKEKVENKFNILEIIVSQLFCCCMCKKIKLKHQANEKANELLFKKLDINVYVRNMILFDLLNLTTIDSIKKPLINFLSRPVVSISQKNKGEFNEFYKNFRERDFNKFYDKIQEVAQKSKRDEGEEKLFSISNERLKSFVN